MNESYSLILIYGENLHQGPLHTKNFFGPNQIHRFCAILLRTLQNPEIGSKFHKKSYNSLTTIFPSYMSMAKTFLRVSRTPTTFLGKIAFTRFVESGYACYRPFKLAPRSFVCARNGKITTPSYLKSRSARFMIPCMLASDRRKGVKL